MGISVINNIQNLRRIHLLISGRVQGVGFRYYTLDCAIKMEVTGWVRNVFGGEVEILAEGNQDRLEAFLLLIKKGPPSSHVTNVKERWNAGTGEFTNFRIRSTGRGGF